MELQLLLLVFAFASVGHCLDNGLARTPQMGWNSWNHFGCGVNETIIMQTAKSLVETGLADLGYVYVNVDDCWAYKREKNGTITSDPATFPHGMKALADYVHSLGLKFGLYSDSGNHTCAGRPGSLGYEDIDAQTYASWDVDYLKYDNCDNTAAMLPQQRYPVMRDALNKTGRPILFSMCEWGVNSPWEWAEDVGNSWRTDNDIGDYFESLIRVLDNQIGLSFAAGPGAWNDPDMLEVGNGGMSFVDYRSHFALWCLLKSPLLIGCDISTIDKQSLQILSSKEVIAVSQDSLGVQGDLVYQFGPLQVWATPLSDGSRAVVLYNRHVYSYYNSSITIFFDMLGYPEGTQATVRDIYAEEDIGIFTDSFTASISGHDSFVGKITPLSMKSDFVNWRPWHASKTWTKF